MIYTWPILFLKDVCCLKKKLLRTDFNEIREFAFPILLEQASIMLMPFVSSFISRGMGTVAVSGVNLIESLNRLTTNVFVAISIGATVVVSQYRGKRDPEAAGQAGLQAIIVSALVAAVAALLLFICTDGAMNVFLGKDVDAELLYYARSYFSASILSYTFYAIYSTASAVLRGAGLTRVSLAGTIIMNVTYIVAGLVMVNVLDMGIAGTGAALVFSRFAGMLAMLLLIPKCRRENIIFPRFTLRLRMSVLRPLITVGIPIMIEQVLFWGGKIITQRFVVGMDAVQLSINSIANVFDGLFNVPGITLSSVAIALAGRRIGAKDFQGAKDLLHDVLTLGFLITTGYLLLWLPFMNAFFRLYTADPVIISGLWSILLMTTLFSPVIWIRSFALSNGMKGAGDVKFTTVIALISMFVFRVMFAYILGVNLGLGTFGIWCGMMVDWTFRAIVFSFRYRSGKWLTKGVL